MKGYWRQEDATAEAIVEGRLRTGDVGHLDEDGYVFIIDRKKDLVLVSGFNVFPRNVEEAIYRHPAVEEVTVIGIPDDYTGEAVKAFVKLGEGAGAGGRGAARLPPGQARPPRGPETYRVPRRAAQDDDRQALQEGAGRGRSGQAGSGGNGVLKGPR